MTNLPQSSCTLGAVSSSSPTAARAASNLTIRSRTTDTFTSGATLEPCLRFVVEAWAGPAATADVVVRLKIVFTSRQEDASSATSSTTFGGEIVNVLPCTPTWHPTCWQSLAHTNKYKEQTAHSAWAEGVCCTLHGGGQKVEETATLAGARDWGKGETKSAQQQHPKVMGIDSESRTGGNGRQCQTRSWAALGTQHCPLVICESPSAGTLAQTRPALLAEDGHQGPTWRFEIAHLDGESCFDGCREDGSCRN